MEGQPARERGTNSNWRRREEEGEKGKAIEIDKEGEVLLMIFCTILRIS